MGAVPLRGCKGCIRVFYLSNGGATVISKVEHELNEEIRDKEIRLIGEDGEQLGIVSSAEGLHIAEEKGLDLVKISPQATPPVCKLMNYGKFKFERSKKEKEARKNQHVVEIKEIRMSPGIDVGDFNTKLKNAQKLNEIGERLAGEYGVSYLVSDFKKRNGYKRSTELSKIYGLYRQDYCGCIYSKNQREREKKLREEEESSVKS